MPTLIGAITVIAQRGGPRVAGVLTALPVVAGPIAFFLAIEQGQVFAAHSAVATLAAVLAVGAFGVAYSNACLRVGPGPSLLAGMSGYALTALALQALDPPLLGALVIGLAAPLLARRLLPHPPFPTRIASIPRAEIAARMGAGAALVALVTSVADRLGPTWSGLLTVFPIATTVLTVSSHRRQGPEFTVHLLRGFASGLYSLVAFFAILALTLEPLGVAPAFALALAGITAAQLALLRWGPAR